MDINKIRADYYAGKYTANVETKLAKVREDYVFDENLSVKQNREMAIEHNKNVDVMRREICERQNALSAKLTNDVVHYIIETYNVSKVVANKIERFVYNEKHAFMCDYFSYIDVIADLVEEAIEAEVDKHEIVKASWIDVTKPGQATCGGNPVYACSNCGYVYGSFEIFPSAKYCRECGAKMKGAVN